MIINDSIWNKPKILLINFGIEALGIRQLSSFLKNLGCEVNILFLRPSLKSDNSYTYAELSSRFIVSNNYDIVGISCMTPDFFEVRDITMHIKEKSGNTPLIIWGGVHPTVCPEECLTNGGADMVFNGACENSLKKLIFGTPPDKTPNITYFDREEQANNYSKIHLLSPDSMPFPDFDSEDHFLIEDNQVLRMTENRFRSWYPWKGTHYYTITARGCPYNCKYCCNIYRKNFLRKSVDYLIKELQSLALRCF